MSDMIEEYGTPIEDVTTTDASAILDGLQLEVGNPAVMALPGAREHIEHALDEIAAAMGRVVVAAAAVQLRCDAVRAKLAP